MDKAWIFADDCPLGEVVFCCRERGECGDREMVAERSSGGG